MMRSTRWAMSAACRALVFGASLCAVLGAAVEAKAEEKTHDGFYMQIQSGLGYYKASADIGGNDQSYSGLTFASSFLLGGSLVPGLVLGGGLLADYAPSPTYKVNGEERSNTPDFKQYVFGIGPFVDFYPNPNDGLHFQGMLGFGALETSSEGNASGSDPTGLLLSLGGGYEWWVGREWSIGAMARLVYAPLSIEDVSYNTIAPALLATFTYH
jgi:hypothetical protein